MTFPTEPRLPWDLDLVPGAPALEVTTRYEPIRGRLHITIRNGGAEPVHPGDLRLAADLDLPIAEGWVWIHGRYMQMDALVRRFGAPAEEGYDGRYIRESDEGGRTYISREVCVLTLPSETTPCLVAGSMRPDRFFFDIEVTVDEDEEYATDLALVFELDGIHLAPGESLELPPILLVDGRDPQALIERYADEVAREMQARVPGHVPTGWCSWYYFYNRVSEADITANLEHMRASGRPAEYVQIDDGFQSHTGDWLMPNEKFPPA
jgi:alpha-galactosidase